MPGQKVEPDIDDCQCLWQTAAVYDVQEAEMVRELTVLDQPAVEACCAPLQAAPLDASQAAELARRFAALSDPVRLRLLNLLATSRSAVCACDLVEPVGKSQPTVSHHLKVLRDAGLVTSDKRGVNVWYAVVPAALDVLRDALAPTR